LKFGATKIIQFAMKKPLYNKIMQQICIVYVVGISRDLTEDVSVSNPQSGRVKKQKNI
jgi:hypothetical protein